QGPHPLPKGVERTAGPDEAIRAEALDLPAVAFQGPVIAPHRGWLHPQRLTAGQQQRMEADALVALFEELFADEVGHQRRAEDLIAEQQIKGGLAVDVGEDERLAVQNVVARADR